MRKILTALGAALLVTCGGAFTWLTYKAIDAFHTPLMLEIANHSGMPIHVRLPVSGGQRFSIRIDADERRQTGSVGGGELADIEFASGGSVWHYDFPVIPSEAVLRTNGALVLLVEIDSSKTLWLRSPETRTRLDPQGDDRYPIGPVP